MCEYSLSPPLLTVLQGPWRRINYIHRILIVNRYMCSEYCTTIKLIQILQFALTFAATLISELIFRIAGRGRVGVPLCCGLDVL